MNTASANQNDSKGTIKNAHHMPRVGRRTLIQEIENIIRGEQRESTIGIPPPLNEQDYSRIHYTQRYINSTFSNYGQMNVFETYFAVKYTFMRVTELPPIQIFKANGHLWSVDNLRLWIMKHGNKFHCEGPFTKEQMFMCNFTVTHHICDV